ncbi:hypothetical protein [Streptomyces anandii]|uniref:hypothetical protein n=1 Tax=Streptomyces anandii TaxID=285454 RepID=UPI0037BC1C5B
MPEDFRYLTPRDPFLARYAGAAIHDSAHCGHDHGTDVGLYFFGRPAAPSDTGCSAPDEEEQRLAVVPRCVLADLFGAVLARIEDSESPEAAERFMDAVAVNRVRAAARLHELAEQRRDCCVAGFRTGGREHTCGRTDTPS